MGPAGYDALIAPAPGSEPLPSGRRCHQNRTARTTLTKRTRYLGRYGIRGPGVPHGFTRPAPTSQHSQAAQRMRDLPRGALGSLIAERCSP